MSVISQRQLLKSSIVLGSACLELMGFAPSALAITVFNFANSSQFTTADGGLTYQYTDTTSNITATLSGYQTNQQFAINQASNGQAEGVRMYDVLDNFPLPDDLAFYNFTMSFSEAVFIDAFVLRSPNPGGTGVEISFINPTSSLTPFATVTSATTSSPQSRAIQNAPLQVSANQSISVSAQVGKFPLQGSGTGYLSGVQVQAVPFESDVLPLLGATLLFGGGMWWKRRRQASQIDLTATLDHGDRPSSES